jgi:hypothetical protein
MVKERTKAEIVEENEYLKKMLSRTIDSQMDLQLNALKMTKAMMKYQVKLNKFDRKFGKVMQILNITILVIYTLIYFLGR